MKTPRPLAVITNAEEYERARREAARLADASGPVDIAVRAALLHAAAIWESRPRRAERGESAEAAADKDPTSQG